MISHILSSITVGILFRFWKKNKLDVSNFSLSYPYGKNNLVLETKLIKISEFGEILGEAIKKSILNLLTIGGFIVLFSVIISILNSSNIINIFSDFLTLFNINPEISKSIFYGIIEVTNGINLSSKYYNNFSTISILVTSFLLGFGGISVLLQIYSIITKENISIRPYFYGKLLQGAISIFFTFCLLFFI